MKDKKDLIGLSHSALVNQVKTLTEPPPVYNMHGLVEENKLKWLFKMLSQVGRKRYPYQSYVRPEVNNGIFKMFSDDNVSVGLLSDWASDTVESHNIAALCGVQDYSIHMGDTYYVGNEKEIAENFNSTLNAPWPYGRFGSFALPGNHEMYSGGRSYFTELLPYMGVYKGEDTHTQEAAFFCLENNYWRVIGLDTGYDSLKGWFGLSSNTELQLHEKQMAWLRGQVKPNDKRGIILLCHHPPLTAFEEEFSGPCKQLAEFFPADKTILWFYGHEHRLAVYGKNQTACGQVYGRCIGNGGMPVELNSKVRNSLPKRAKERNLLVFDNRIREKIDDDIHLGHNGYTLLHFNNSDLVVEYYDDNNNKKNATPRKTMHESWTINIQTGELKIKDAITITNEGKGILELAAE